MFDAVNSKVAIQHTVDAAALYALSLPVYSIKVAEFFASTTSKQADFIIETGSYFEKGLATKTSNQMTDQVDHRLFYDILTGLLYWRLSSTSTISRNVGITYPEIPKCTSADSFTLTQPGTIFIDLDVSHLPYKQPQSYFVTNSGGWLDTSQKVHA